MHFDGTITLGAVLNVATLAVAIVVFGLRMDGRLKMTERWIELHDKCGQEIMKALSVLQNDVAYLRGVSDTTQKFEHGSPQLKDKY